MFIKKTYPLFLTIMLIVVNAMYSQDSVKFSIEPAHPNVSLSFVSLSNTDYFLYHSPSKQDQSLYKKHKALIDTKPYKKNCSLYYSLACALWELEKTEEAKKMFLQIMDSKEPYFCGTHHYNSDVPGDTTSNSYGYGSYTSNYKNYACRYLAKICIEEKQFDEAFKYMEAAEKNYIIQYSCGTGRMWYRNEMNGLLGLCYEGQGKYEKVIDLFLTNSYDWNIGGLTRSLKKLYRPSEILDSLNAAENSLIFVADSLPSSYFTYENYGKKTELKKEIKYASGKATIRLFGKQIQLPSPIPYDGEVINKEYFVQSFRESGLYKNLTAEQ